MMAEIERDDDDEEIITRPTAHHGALDTKADAKSRGKDSERPTKARAVPKSSALHEVKPRDDSSLPCGAVPAKLRSRRGSRSHDEMKQESDSTDDDSDEERETRVRHQGGIVFQGPTQKPSPKHEKSAECPDENTALRMFVTHAHKLSASIVRCYVQRDRQGMNRFNPVYRLFLEDGDRFLLTAQKRSSSTTSYYLLSLSQSAVDRRSPLVVAKLRANWSGFVEFAYDDVGPGRLNARIPKVSESGSGYAKWRDREFGHDHAARQAFESALDSSALLLRNKRPQFDAMSGGHVLDFQGRVTMPSVKNFQMQSEAHGDDTVLQFGRVSCQPPGPQRQCKCHKDTFMMDLRHPLSPVQAFAICLAALDAKVADGKTFDRVSSLFQKLSS